MFAITFAAALSLVASLPPLSPDAPARQAQMAAQGNTVYLAYGAGNGIYFTASTDEGKTFSAPIRVAEAAVLPLSRHRGPRIAVSGGAVVITAVTGKTLSQGAHAHGLPSDGDLLVWRSVNGGRTWSTARVVNDVPGAPTEGLHTLAADGRGHLFAAWLDKRSGAGIQLYGSLSRDGGATWGKNVLIYQSPDGTVCECCHPSAAFDPSGDLWVMWRNALGGSRDMYLTRSADGAEFGKASQLGNGTWQLNACPMDGGGLVAGPNGMLTAWRRNKGIFFAKPGEPEKGVGEGMDVALAAGIRGVYAIWGSSTGVKALLPGAETPVTLAPQGTFPTILALPGGHALAAWETEGKIEVKPVP